MNTYGYSSKKNIWTCIHQLVNSAYLPLSGGQEGEGEVKETIFKCFISSFKKNMYYFVILLAEMWNYRLFFTVFTLSMLDMSYFFN